MTEQERETWRSRCAEELWARRYASGPNDVQRGWWRPSASGRSRRLHILTRADVRDLVDYLEAEHGKRP